MVVFNKRDMEGRQTKLLQSILLNHNSDMMGIMNRLYVIEKRLDNQLNKLEEIDRRLDESDDKFNEKDWYDELKDQI
jgi:division protein CdvB (Snf7/Vps24/ESCRT-III family)